MDSGEGAHRHSASAASISGAGSANNASVDPSMPGYGMAYHAMHINQATPHVPDTNAQQQHTHLTAQQSLPPVQTYPGAEAFPAFMDHSMQVINPSMMVPYQQYAMQLGQIYPSMPLVSQGAWVPQSPVKFQQEMQHQQHLAPIKESASHSSNAANKHEASSTQNSAKKAGKAAPGADNSSGSNTDPKTGSKVTSPAMETSNSSGKPSQHKKRHGHSSHAKDAKGAKEGGGKTKNRRHHK